MYNVVQVNKVRHVSKKILNNLFLVKAQFYNVTGTSEQLSNFQQSVKNVSCHYPVQIMTLLMAAKPIHRWPNHMVRACKFG